MLTTTLQAIRAHNPCDDGWKQLLKALGKTGPDNEPLLLETILEHNGIWDALWALRCVVGYQNAIRLYRCYCVRCALPAFETRYPNDKRPRNAIEISERFARGLATEEELKTARDAAWDAYAAGWTGLED